MRRWLKFATLICTLSLLGSAVGLSAESTSESRQAVALWLSQQIQRPVAAAQLLIVPTVTHLDGCSVAHARSSVIGTTALSLHCPSQGLPQLALLNFSVATPDQSTAFSPLASHRVFLKVTPTPPTLVHAGAALNADWRTDTIHVQLPVVAFDLKLKV